MRMSSMCEYIQWRYTMEGFIQWSEMCEVWRGTQSAGGSCCRRLEEDVLNWGRGVRGERINYSINELIIVLYKN